MLKEECRRCKFWKAPTEVGYQYGKCLVDPPGFWGHQSSKPGNFCGKFKARFGGFHIPESSFQNVESVEAQKIGNGTIRKLPLLPGEIPDVDKLTLLHGPGRYRLIVTFRDVSND